MRRILASWAAFLVFFGLAVSAMPRTVANVNMPERMEVQGKQLVLNGVGIRKATILNVKVYVAGLYLETPSKDPGQIIRSTQSKRLVMHFLRDVDRDDIVKAWSDGFRKNNKNLDQVKVRIAKLTGWMRDAKEGNTITLTYANGSVEMAFGTKVLGTIDGADFAQALFSIWLGPEPPDQDLKKGLLGK